MPTLQSKNNLVTLVYVGARVWETLTVENRSVRMNYSVFGRCSQIGQRTTNSGQIQDTSSSTADCVDLANSKREVPCTWWVSN